LHRISDIVAIKPQNYSSAVSPRIKLVANCCDQETAGENEIFSAIDRGNQKKVASLIDAGVSLHKTNANGDTPLTHAIRKGRHKFVALLLAAGSDPNYQRRLDKSDKWLRGQLRRA
jgi:ankyrin repeat protein